MPGRNPDRTTRPRIVPRVGGWSAGMHSFGPNMICIHKGCNVDFDSHQIHHQQCTSPEAGTRRAYHRAENQDAD